MMSSCTPCLSTTFMASLTSCCAHSGWAPPVSCFPNSILRRSEMHSSSSSVSRHSTQCLLLSPVNKSGFFRVPSNLIIRQRQFSDWEVFCRQPWWIKKDHYLFPHESLFLSWCFPFPLLFCSCSSLLASSPLRLHLPLFPPLTLSKLSVWGSVMNCPVWLCIWPMPTHGRDLSSRSIDELTLKDDSACLALRREGKMGC